MSFGDKAATRILETVSGSLWDLKANLMSDIVDQHGAGRSLAWFAANMPKYEKILKVWGPLRTHYLASAISIINGCGYCTYGHAYAFNLHFFEQRNELFPLSEEDLRDAKALGAQEAEALLAGALVDGDMADEVEWLTRTVGIMESRTASDADDERLLHLVEMFAWLNSCGVKGDTEPDEAHDPINKNGDLRRRYHEARSSL